MATSLIISTLENAITSGAINPACVLSVIHTVSQIVQNPADLKQHITDIIQGKASIPSLPPQTIEALKTLIQPQATPQGQGQTWWSSLCCFTH